MLTFAPNSLSPAELILIGTAQGIASMVFEVPTGVVADTYSRKWAVVIAHAVTGVGMFATGFVTSFPALVVTNALWGVGHTFGRHSYSHVPRAHPEQSFSAFLDDFDVHLVPFEGEFAQRLLDGLLPRFGGNFNLSHPVYSPLSSGGVYFFRFFLPSRVNSRWRALAAV